MENKKLKQNLEHIKILVDECLIELGAIKNESTNVKRSKVAATLSSPKTLSDYILDLRDDKFFAQPKTVKEVHEKMQSVYHCELNRVAVALIRLQGKKQLRKASKTIEEKSVIAYAW